MAKRNNDYSFWTAFARWAIVGLAVLTIAFNTGVTYNHLHELSGKVETMTEDVKEMKAALESIRLAIGLDKIQK